MPDRATGEIASAREELLHLHLKREFKRECATAGGDA